ncbi:MAG: hypothetical protein LBU39_07045 [Desulfobulbaceae bacterium]|nr:hypothetical protein [Desulfobulbaceae bacterium]
MIIDHPSGLVYTVDFKSSNEIFSDERSTGLDINPGDVTVVGHSLGGHLAIAFRGTEGITDIVSDILVGYYNFNPQFSVDKEFVQQMMAEYSISSSNLTLTGHSPGGILSQSIGADTHI